MGPDPETRVHPRRRDPSPGIPTRPGPRRRHLPLDRPAAKLHPHPRDLPHDPPHRRLSSPPQDHRVSRRRNPGRSLPSDSPALQHRHPSLLLPGRPPRASLRRVQEDDLIHRSQARPRNLHDSILRASEAVRQVRHSLPRVPPVGAVPGEADESDGSEPGHVRAEHDREGLLRVRPRGRGHRGVQGHGGSGVSTQRSHARGHREGSVREGKGFARVLVPSTDEEDGDDSERAGVHGGDLQLGYGGSARGGRGGRLRHAPVRNVAGLVDLQDRSRGDLPRREGRSRFPPLGGVSQEGSQIGLPGLPDFARSLALDQGRCLTSNYLGDQKQVSKRLLWRAFLCTARQYLVQRSQFRSR